MRVREIWRYPVKSLQGEQVETCDLDEFGLVGDRRWAIFDLETGYGLTARRRPELLYAGARCSDSGSVEIVLPDGAVAEDDAALSAWLGHPVQLRPAGSEDGAGPTYENPDDFETEAPESWAPFTGATGAFHDAAAYRVSLVSAQTIGSWDRRRFRSNVLLDGGGEEDLVGRRIALGSAELAVGAGIERCVMTTRPQPDGIEKDVNVLRAIHRKLGGLLAVGARVTTSGQFAIGDELRPQL